MKTHAGMVTAWVVGALALLPGRVASAQGPEVPVGGLDVDKMTAPALFSSSLAPGWWRSITDALDAMRGLRGRRIPLAAARQVDLRAATALPELPVGWQDLPSATPTAPHLLALRFGPVDGTPVQIEPLSLSPGATADSRREPGELLGARIALPWLVP